MPLRKGVSLFVSAGLGGVVFFLLTAAWFHIQAVRLGYKTQGLRQDLDELVKKEQILDQGLQRSLSLYRLDELAKNRYDLRVPDPSQLILVPESSGLS
jgi:hypothetical protein